MTQSRAVMTTCCTAMVTMSFTVGGLAMCTPSMAQELGLDYARQGLILSAPMWSFGISVAVAAVADRVGFRGLLVLASAMQAVGWFVMAEVQGFPQALAGAVFVGIGGSVVDPLLTPLVCAVYPDRRARMANFLHGFYCLGLIGVALLVMAIQPAGVTWRWTFRLLGVLCVPYGVVSALGALPRQAHRGPQRLRVRTLMRGPVFWGVAIAMFLGAMTELGPANWLPSLVQSLAAPGGPTAGSTLLAGAGLALFGTLMAVGRFTASAAAGRVGVHRLLAVAAGVSMVCLAAVALPLGTAWRIGCLGAVGLSVACFWPTLLSIAGDRFPEAGASMYSVLSAVGCIGCAVAPAAVGYLAEGFGSLAPAMAALALAPALVLVVSLRLRPR